VTMTAGSDLYYDPFDVEIRQDPYPVYKRLRDEQPLWHNDQLDFYVVSRFEDVERGLVDRKTFSSARGVVLGMIEKPDVQIPAGLFIAEDAPFHTMHRSVVSRVFTVKAMEALEPQVRAFTAQTLDVLVGSGRFDFVKDLGMIVPMQVISMLVGIPEKDQGKLRQMSEDALQRAYDPEQAPFAAMGAINAVFEEYIAWRKDHPSDDLLTKMLTLTFEDQSGTTRHLSHDEVLTYLNVIATGGSDTTTRLIGWAGSILAQYPEQRQRLIDDPSLIPNAVNEILRYEPPPYHIARHVVADAEFHGQVVPKGSILVMLPAAANRDERHFPDPDTFDVGRKIDHMLSFGYGPHFCLGAALARLEGRVVIDELLKRFPTWDIDWDGARLTDGYMTRGWETLPAMV
jgi:cytochrome P450